MPKNADYVDILSIYSPCFDGTDGQTDERMIRFASFCGGSKSDAVDLAYVPAFERALWGTSYIDSIRYLLLRRRTCSRYACVYAHVNLCMCACTYYGSEIGGGGERERERSTGRSMWIFSGRPSPRGLTEITGQRALRLLCNGWYSGTTVNPFRVVNSTEIFPPSPSLRSRFLFPPRHGALPSGFLAESGFRL